MMAMITAGLVALGLLLQIIVWLGSYKRKREKRRREIQVLLQKLAEQLSEALVSNDTDRVSELSRRLRDLREEYRVLNRQR